MIAERQPQLNAFYRRVFGPAERAQAAPSPSAHRPSHLTDGEIVRRASEARNGDKFRRLFFDGDTSDHGGDDSVADLALCSHLAFWTRDEGQIDRLFRKSELCRDKWANRPDYRERTIKKALELATNRYSPAGSAERAVPTGRRPASQRVRAVEIVGGKAVQR
jgi:putative DNA primase/helicase